MASQTAIEAAGLEKSYGAVKVLAGVDLRVECGSVFALLGPNGAGKTTTVRILSTLIRDRHRLIGRARPWTIRYEESTVSFWPEPELALQPDRETPIVVRSTYAPRLRTRSVSSGP